MTDQTLNQPNVLEGYGVRLVLPPEPAPGPQRVQRPLRLVLPGINAEFSVLACSLEHAMLACDGGAAPRATSRIGLERGDEDGGGIRLLVEVIGQATAPPGVLVPCVAVRWLAVEALRSRWAFARALTDLLRIPAEVIGEDALTPGQLLIFDVRQRALRVTNRSVVAAQADPSRSSRVTQRRIRVPARTPTPRPGTDVRDTMPVGVAKPRKRRNTGRFYISRQAARQTGQMDAIGKFDPRATQPGVNPDDMAGIELGLSADVEDLVGVRVGRGPARMTDALHGRHTLGRTGPRLHPIYRISNTRSHYRLHAGVRACVFGWVGLTHCLFMVQGDGGPVLGDEVQVAVPGRPVSAEPIWVTGVVSQLSVDPGASRTRVELDLQVPGAVVPRAYESLVAHYARG